MARRMHPLAAMLAVILDRRGIKYLSGFPELELLDFVTALFQQFYNAIWT